MTALLLVLPALLLPALVALTALRGGAYPGEELLDRARRARAAHRPDARPAAPHHHARLPRPPRRVRPRGGALLARRLAGRAPPSMA